jgi:cell division protein FtsI/penicillin-binding protein 2
MGLCEAIKRSSNLYFGGLAHLLTMSDPKRPTAALEDLARRLSFDSDTCRNAKGQTWSCGFDLTRGLLGASGTGRLRADPVNFDDCGRAAERRRDASAAAGGPPSPCNMRTREKERDATLSGFGDAQSATAVAMTAVYASLATHKQVRPSLLALERDDKGCPRNRAPGECEPAFPAAVETSPLFGLLKSGLQAVVRAGGTAQDKLNGAPVSLDNVYAKTGTATYRDRRNHLDASSRPVTLNALWLAGWIEGDGRPGPLGHRLAFACQVTGAPEGKFGADFCGPAIRDVLKNLAAASR